MNDLHSVIEDHFQNYDLLRKVEQDTKTVFLIFTQEVMFLEVSNKSNNKQSKLKTKKKSRKQYFSNCYIVFIYIRWKRLLPMLYRRWMNIIWWNIILIKMEFYILLGVFTVIIVAFQLMKNIFVNLVGVRNDNVFCCRKYMAKNVEFDQEGYFKCIKIGLFKFVFLSGVVVYLFSGLYFHYYWIDIYNFFTIFGSCIDIQKLVTTLVIQSEKNWTQSYY